MIKIQAGMTAESLNLGMNLIYGLYA